jgi:DNA topoisomerase IB
MAETGRFRASQPEKGLRHRACDLGRGDRQGAGPAARRPERADHSRIKRGKGYSFVRPNGAHIRDARTIRRLHAMAVPPAYRQVRYSADPSSHLQAVGSDAAGPAAIPLSRRLGKGPRAPQGASLARLVGALPKIRPQGLGVLSGDEPTREFALSAVIELIARTAIRPATNPTPASTAPAARPRC